MGFLDRVKKDIVKKSGDDVPAEKQAPKVRGLSREAKELLEKLQKEKEQKKYLGMVIDATASREASWDRAQKILRTIFQKLSEDSGLQIRVIYFGGDRVGDLGWSGDLLSVQKRMAEVGCERGLTQIVSGFEKFFQDRQKHLPENVILIGDAFEEEVKDLKKILVTFREKNIRVFSFYDREGGSARPETDAEMLFRKISKVTNGVFQEYQEGVYLDDLIVATATFAAEGMKGLERLVKENNRAALTLKKELLQIEEKK
ncbi:MAG: VWA domain-containing protein [Candidatus Omnitrophota bacterium]